MPLKTKKNIASLKSNNGNSAINSEDVKFKVIAVKNKKKIDHLMEKVDLDKTNLEKKIDQIKRANSNIGKLIRVNVRQLY